MHGQIQSRLGRAISGDAMVRYQGRLDDGLRHGDMEWLRRRLLTSSILRDKGSLVEATNSGFSASRTLPGLWGSQAGECPLSSPGTGRPACVMQRLSAFDSYPCKKFENSHIDGTILFAVIFVFTYCGKCHGLQKN